MVMAMGKYFFLMFGTDMYIPILTSLLKPNLQYLGDKSSLLLKEILSEAYMIAAIINLKRARDKQPIKKTKDSTKFKLVLLKNHKKQTWDTKYMPNFHICKVINDGIYDIQDLTGHVRNASVADIQFLMPAENIVSMLLPDIKVFRQACKSINYPSFIPGKKGKIVV